MRLDRTLALLALLCLLQTPVRAQTPTTSATSANSSEVAAFQQVEDAWSAALNSHDQYGMELVLSPLFVDISASGEITTRNQQIAQLLASDDKNLHADQHVITVRQLGEVAVVNGTYLLRHKSDSGVVEERGVFTHVFERERGSWLCLNAQRTAIREEGPQKSKKVLNRPGSSH